MNTTKKFINLYYRKKEQLLQDFESDVLHDKIYRFGSYLFIIFGLVLFIVPRLSITNDALNVFSYISYVFLTIFSIAVIIEYSVFIIKYYQKTWLKILGIFLGAFAYKVAVIHTDHIINNFTGIDPSFFPSAATVLITLSLIYIWLLISILIILILILISALILNILSLLTSINKKLNFFHFLKLTGRLIGLFAIAMILESSIKKFNDKESLVESLSQNIIITTEYFAKSRCKELDDNSGELYAELPRGMVSVYNPTTQKFRVDKCKINP